MSLKAQNFTHILIDDDSIVRRLWTVASRAYEVSFFSFSRAEDFMARRSEFPLDSVLYVDYELGDQKQKGDQWASTFYDFGFKNIIICTGHDAEQLTLPPFIQEVRGKGPPW